MKHAFTEELFRFPFELLLSFFRLYSRFSCRRKFLSKRTKRKEKRLQHYAITSREKRKLSEKAKQKAKLAKKKSWNERAIRRRTKRNYPVNKLLLWRDTSRAKREIVMAVQGLPVHQWQVKSSKFACFRELSRKFYYRLRCRRFRALRKHRRFESNLNPRMRYFERDVCCLPFPSNGSSWLRKCFFVGKTLATFVLKLCSSTSWDLFVWNGAERTTLEVEFHGKAVIWRTAQSSFRISRQLVVLMDEATSPGQGWIGIH